MDTDSKTHPELIVRRGKTNGTVLFSLFDGTDQPLIKNKEMGNIAVEISKNFPAIARMIAENDKNGISADIIPGLDLSGLEPSQKRSFVDSITKKVKC